MRAKQSKHTSMSLRHLGELRPLGAFDRGRTPAISYTQALVMTQHVQSFRLLGKEGVGLWRTSRSLNLERSRILRRELSVMETGGGGRGEGEEGEGTCDRCLSLSENPVGSWRVQHHRPRRIAPSLPLSPTPHYLMQSCALFSDVEGENGSLSCEWLR